MRKLWLDWQRGLAVLFMVEVHVLDAWLAPDVWRGTLSRAVLVMIGGFAAPGFLYMAGLSQALSDSAQQRKGVDPAARRRQALRRALWLFGFAYAFRLAEYFLGGAWLRPGGWNDLLKVDILNVIGVGLAASALLSVGRSGRTGAVLAGVAALALVLATPVVADVLRHYDIPRAGVAAAAPLRHAPNRLLDVAYAYVYGSWPRANFHLFNWMAFLLAGAAIAPIALERNRPALLLGIAAALLGIGWWSDRWPDFFAYQNYWRTSPSWFAMRLGVCVALTGALQLVPAGAQRVLGWLTLMGRQSLVGYIASVELTYGALARPFRKSLSFGATMAGMVSMMGVAWAICLGWERLHAWRKARRAQAGAGPLAA